jgi:4-amino-4-deoxy-L-arabinose transferase-like glycosyltransferase
MRWLAAALGLTLAVRLLTLGTYPLRDTTEARYGEIVRIMRVSGNWVTPQETVGTPFWAKPPLYAWLGAVSVDLLGVDELALRLPSFLCGLAVLLLCWRWSAALARRAASLHDPDPAHASPDALAPLVSCVVLATSVLFFVGFGSVMTDPSLCLCTAWMTVAFQRAVVDGSPRAVWRYGFFVAAGLAMLAKGPVALVYTGLPIVLWVAWRGRLRTTWQALPWIAGTVLSAAICVPWYLWAEARTPGFLNYFLVGEHLMRYLHPGWSGDRYGNAHREPIGTIWLCLAEALGLWSIALVALLRPARGWMAGARAWLNDDGRLLAALTAFAPLVVFTFARNLIWTYAMPSLLPIAVLLGPELSRRWARPGRWRRGLTALAALSVAVLAVGAIAWAPGHASGNSYAAPVAAWQQRAAAQPGPLLYWGARMPASLRFYSRGQAQAMPDLPARLQQLDGGGRVYVALDSERLAELRQLAYTAPAALDLQVVGQVRHALIAQIERR